MLIKTDLKNEEQFAGLELEDGEERSETIQGKGRAYSKGRLR